jgi:glutamate synthase (ferredoxin)
MTISRFNGAKPTLHDRETRPINPAILANWDQMVPKFVKVMPRDYKRVLQAIQNALASGLSGDDALNAAFEENSRDVARIGGS